MNFDRKTFFDGYRSAFGSLNNSQVEGLEFLLGKLEADTFSLKQTAYILATIHHETGVRRNGELQTFQPIREVRAKVGTKLRKTQDRYWATGHYGRGLVQITWPDNYAKFGIRDDPDKALEPEKAYEITSRGMREGMFTGKRLSHYINGTADYYNARKIINGLDKAEEIAAKAVAYESILKRSAAAYERLNRLPALSAVVIPEPDKPSPDTKADGTQAKAGEPAPDTPAAPGEAIVGGRPDDPPKEVTKGSNQSKVAIGGGVVLSAASAAWSYISNHANVAVVGIVCLTVLILAYVFRQVILDYARLQLGADPSKYNVK